MLNEPGYFEIQAEDVEKARNFYTGVFGWELKLMPGFPIEYWMIEINGKRSGGILKRPCPPPALMQGTNAFTVSMEVKNFDDTAKKIMELGGMIAMEKFAVPGVCWQGYFIDTDHNTFGIFQPDPNAQ